MDLIFNPEYSLEENLVYSKYVKTSEHLNTPYVDEETFHLQTRRHPILHAISIQQEFLTAEQMAYMPYPAPKGWDSGSELWTEIHAKLLKYVTDEPMTKWDQSKLEGVVRDMYDAQTMNEELADLERIVTDLLYDVKMDLPSKDWKEYEEHIRAHRALKKTPLRLSRWAATYYLASSRSIRPKEQVYDPTPEFPERDLRFSYQELMLLTEQDHQYFKENRTFLDPARWVIERRLTHPLPEIGPNERYCTPEIFEAIRRPSVGRRYTRRKIK